MGVQRSGRVGGAARLALAAAGALALVAIAGGSRADPVPRHAVAGAVARGGPGSGVISTVAGGVGGPGKGTAVSVGRPCGVSFGAGHVVVAQTQAVREISRPAAG
jgi:hypothetical protein